MINIIMCGSSGSRPTPSEIFYKENSVRRNIIEGLHRGDALDKIAETLSLNYQEFMRHIKIMEAAGYVSSSRGTYSPGFFVALADEVEVMKGFAEPWGERISTLIQKQENWRVIEDVYKKLSVFPRFSFKRIGLPLVGDFLLDIGMLKVFYKDSTIMPQPSDKFGGNFYVWGVEGGYDSLGRYGSHSESFNDMSVFSFGGGKERKRATLPDAYWGMTAEIGKDGASKIAKAVIAEYVRYYDDATVTISNDSLKYLVKWKYIRKIPEGFRCLAPVYKGKDFPLVRSLAQRMGKIILEQFKDEKRGLDEQFRKLRGSKHSSFAEFFCWFWHLVFSETIDSLIEVGKISKPRLGYEYGVATIPLE